MKGFTLKPCPVCGSSLYFERESGDDFALVCFLGGHRFENKEAIKKLIEKTGTRTNISRQILQNKAKKEETQVNRLQDGLSEALAKREDYLITHPIPPKPQGEQHVIRMQLSQYYKDHAAEMIEEVKLLGDAAARARWGCSESFWIKFRAEHGLPKPPSPGKGRKKHKTLAARTTTDWVEKNNPCTQKPAPDSAALEEKLGIKPADGPGSEKFYCLGDDCAGGDCAAAKVKGIIIGPGEEITEGVKPCPAAKRMADNPVENESTINLTPLYCPPDCTQKNDTCIDASMCRGFMPDTKAIPSVFPQSPVCGNYARPQPAQHFIKLDIDTSEAEAKIKHLYELKQAILPKPRWWWTPQTLRHYMSTVERLFK